MNEKAGRDPLEKVARDSGRIMAFTSLMLGILLVVALLGGSLVLSRVLEQLSRQAGIVTREEASICDFFNVIATVSVVTSGPHTTSRVVVRWIIDSRNTYTERYCTPKLSPPPAGLVMLAREYRLSVGS